MALQWWLQWQEDMAASKQADAAKSCEISIVSTEFLVLRFAGYQFLTIAVFLLAFPLNVLLKATASIYTVFICEGDVGALDGGSEES